MAKIYTRTGDSGETSLFGGERVRKDELRVEAAGTIDELNAALGVARAELTRTEPMLLDYDKFLEEVQHELFNLGAELATMPPAHHTVDRIEDDDIVRIEESIDVWSAGLEPLREFILPGGFPAAAELHMARCICRRAERLVVRLAAVEPIRREVIGYLNRLSDALFVLARAVNCSANVPDLPWRRTD